MCYNNYSSNNTNRNNNNNNNININNDKQIMSNNSSDNSNNSKQIISDTIINSTNSNINNRNNIINSNSIKGNFRTPLTPLHRGGLGGLHMGGLRRLQMCGRESVHQCGREEFYKKGLRGLHWFGLDRFCDNTLRYAFSLIELSIVLIIIGLLVAGVTGGKSLIDSARSRALINELREYERAVWTFRAARDRFPGDVMNYGTFGWQSNYFGDGSSTYSGFAEPYYAYKGTDFPSDFITEFRKTAGSSAIPNYNSASFVDLYTEGIIDFKPLGNTNTASKTSTTKGIPNSKAIDTNNVCFYFLYTGTLEFYSETPVSNGNYQIGLRYFGSIKEIIEYAYSGASASKGMDPKVLKQVDQKLDDGEHWNGRMRTSCYGKSSTGAASNTAGYADYDYAIDNKKKCNVFLYAL